MATEAARDPCTGPPARPRAGRGAALVLLLVVCCRHAAEPASRPGWTAGGWAPYWDLDTAMREVAASDGRLADVFLFVAQLDRDGAPVLARPQHDYARAAAEVRAAGAAPWLTIVNDVADGAGSSVQKDPGVVHEVLTDPGRRRAHREAIVSLARGLGVSGVDLDYERVRAADRQLFSAFVAELSEDVRRAGLLLSVTVQPKAAESASDGTGAADWAALCGSADRLQIMLYNEHSGRTAPGPLATPTWVDRILSFALTQCPPAQIVPALKVIGMEWSPDGTRDVPYADAVALAGAERVVPRRDPDGDVPWFTYGPGGARTVYYEDARSLSVKLAAVLRRGVPGVVLWSLGREDPALWAAVDELQNRAAKRRLPARER